jgi:hypothetical protein
VQEAEFALAREQLKTQTPQPPLERPEQSLVAPAGNVQSGRLAPRDARSAHGRAAVARGASGPPESKVAAANVVRARQSEQATKPVLSPPAPPPDDAISSKDIAQPLATAPTLPADWPDPRGFIPPPPAPERPLPRPQAEPIISHTRIYHGQDAKFTERLATYYYLRDDARFGGWPAYLDRPGDFIRFCCHLHVTETLAARGGTGEARVLWRWPIRRYER